MNDEQSVKVRSHKRAQVAVKDVLVIDDLETLRALTDRLRMRILDAFSRATGDPPTVAPRTVKEVARELGLMPTRLYYHVNLLEERGLLIVAGSRIVSGIVEKRYLPAARNFKVDRALLSMSAGDQPEGAAVEMALTNLLDAAEDDLRAALRDDPAELGPDRGLFSSGTVRLTADQARRLRAALTRIIATPESDAPQAAEYRLTVVFHRASNHENAQ